MSENVTQKDISRTQVEDAIHSVRSRGWDVNPYTVAEEAKVFHGDISKNPEFMQLIIAARGGDVSFQPAKPDQQTRVAELEAEVRALRDKLNTHQPAALPNDDDVLNEQVKALLSSESDEQVKHLELELETAYHKTVSLEEEKVDLTRSVTGLEKINEALNLRMRELEGESAELKRQLASQPAERPNKSYEEMENINREMALRLEELISNHRANNEHIALLEANNNQHELVILELEAKLAELQQEADMLALQLQNAFNVGYQKAVADNKAKNEANAQAAQAAQSAAQQVQEISQELTGEFGAPPSQVQTGDQQVHNQDYQAHETAEEAPVDTNQQGWNTEANNVLNFARTGPYVASTFNPLESLSWRDLETVYSMGVLSIRDFSRNLTDYTTGNEAAFQSVVESANAAQQNPPPPQESQTHSFSEARSTIDPRPFPDDTIQPNSGLKAVRRFPDDTIETQAFSEADLQQHHQQYAEVQDMFHDEYGHPVGDDSQPQTIMFADGEAEQTANEPPKSDGALDFIDELIDLDKLDIFESLEDLAELGNIDVLNEPMQINFDDLSENTVETPSVSDPSQPVSDEELRLLLINRVASAQSQQDSSGEQTVRTPAAPDSSSGIEEEVKQNPIPGLSRKFIGGKAAQAAAGTQSSDSTTAAPQVTASSTATPSLKHIPQDIRKACMILGIRPEDLTKELVNKEWKRQITSVHPDLKGGDTETSIFLNTAKDTLLRWLDQNTPKLGGKFGQKGSSSPFTGKNKSDDKS